MKNMFYKLRKFYLENLYDPSINFLTLFIIFIMTTFVYYMVVTNYDKSPTEVAELKPMVETFFTQDHLKVIIIVTLLVEIFLKFLIGKPLIQITVKSNKPSKFKTTYVEEEPFEVDLQNKHTRFHNYMIDANDSNRHWFLFPIEGILQIRGQGKSKIELPILKVTQTTIDNDRELINKYQPYIKHVSRRKRLILTPVKLTNYFWDVGYKTIDAYNIEHITEIYLSDTEKSNISGYMVDEEQYQQDLVDSVFNPTYRKDKL